MTKSITLRTANLEMMTLDDAICILLYFEDKTDNILIEALIFNARREIARRAEIALSCFQEKDRAAQEASDLP